MECIFKALLFCSHKYKNTAGEAVMLVNSLQGTGHERQVYMVVMSPPKTRAEETARPGQLRSTNTVALVGLAKVLFSVNI